jgi:polar amino acid transport system permease protein
MSLREPVSARKPPPPQAVPWHRRPWWDAVQFALAAALLIGLAYHGATQMGYQWKWDRVPRYVVRVIEGEWLAGPLLKGLMVTVELALKASVLALLIGALTAWMRTAPSRVGRALTWSYIELIRNTPLLVQILVCYFILAPALGMGRETTGVVCLALYEGAFAAEIIRGALQAVPKGQREASLSLGMTEADTARDIVWPQALPLMLPPLAGVLVNLVKHSAIVSVIAVFDLTTQARTIISDTFMAFEIWLTTAALYLCITVSLSLAVSALERRVRRRRW